MFLAPADPRWNTRAEKVAVAASRNTSKNAESGMASLPLEKIVPGPRGSTWQLTIDIFWKPIKCFTAVLPSPSSQPIKSFKSQLIGHESNESKTNCWCEHAGHHSQYRPPFFGDGLQWRKPHAMQGRKQSCPMVQNWNIQFRCSHNLWGPNITRYKYTPDILQNHNLHNFSAAWLAISRHSWRTLAVSHRPPTPKKETTPQIMGSRCEKSRGWDEFRGSLFFPLHLRLHVIVPFWCVLKTPSSIKKIYIHQTQLVFLSVQCFSPRAPRRNWKLSYIHHRDLNCNHPFHIHPYPMLTFIWERDMIHVTINAWPARAGQLDHVDVDVGPHCPFFDAPIFCFGISHCINRTHGPSKMASFLVEHVKARLALEGETYMPNLAAGWAPQNGQKVFSAFFVLGQESKRTSVIYDQL